MLLQPKYIITNKEIRINPHAKGGKYIVTIKFKDISKFEYSYKFYNCHMTIWFDLNNELVMLVFAVPLLENATQDWKSIVNHVIQRLPKSTEVISS